MRQLAFCVAGLFVLFLPANVVAQSRTVPFIGNMHSPWVDSVMNTLSPDERIAQLIVLAGWSNRGPEHRQQMLQMIREQKIGGIIFFQGGPGRQVALINEYQRASK